MYCTCFIRDEEKVRYKKKKKNVLGRRYWDET